MSIDVIAGATAGPFAAACVVLAFAGGSKIVRPSATRPAATALGLPGSPGAVRALGAVEAVGAVAALAIGGVAAVAVAAIYGALALAAWRLLVRAAGNRVRVPRRVGHSGHGDARRRRTSRPRSSPRSRRPASSPLSAVGERRVVTRRVRRARRLLRVVGHVRARCASGAQRGRHAKEAPDDGAGRGRDRRARAARRRRHRTLAQPR